MTSDAQGCGRHRPKVLFVVTWYPTEDEPAARTFVRDHACAVNRYVDVTVLHCQTGSKSQAKIAECRRDRSAITWEIPTYRLAVRPPPGFRGILPLWIWGATGAVRRDLLGGFRPDLLHAHVYTAGVVGAFLGMYLRVPLIITEHYSAFHDGHLGWLERRKARWAFGRASRVLPVSHALGESISGLKISPRFEVVPNPVDTAAFYPSESRGRSGAGLSFICIGRLHPSKGIDVLLHALGSFLQDRRDWRLDVVGDGPLAGNYKKLAAALGIEKHVSFLGALPRPDVAERLRRADLCIVPSRVETFSVVAAEALASGVPVLATASGGPEAFVGSGQGLIVARDDACALLEGLRQLIHRLGEFSSSSLAAYAKDRFAFDAIGQRLANIYSSVLGEKGARQNVPM